MADLQLRGVRKTYAGGAAVLHGLDLDIADGEFMVFVGPSGCGKSTLLRMIAGLEDISGGEIRIGGEPVNDLAPAERGVAMVFQSYALYPHMTVAQNLGFALKMAGRPTDEIARKVADAARVLQLEALLDRKPRQLSGGQRQRVAIGRAIVRQPKVFLFDEPLSNLDAALRVQMRIELARLHRELGTTMVYVTHDQVEAMTLGDRIALFNAGRIEQVGPPLRLYERPASRFVAGFLGTPQMNLLPADGAGRVWADQAAAERGLGAAAAAAASAAPGTTPWTVGLRPEHLQLLTPGAAAPQDTLAGMPARLERIEHLGDAVYAWVTPEAGGAPLAARLAPGAALPATGSPVQLAAHPGHLHLFGGDGRAVIGPRSTHAPVPSAAAEPA